MDDLDTPELSVPFKGHDGDRTWMLDGKVVTVPGLDAKILSLKAKKVGVLVSTSGEILATTYVSAKDPLPTGDRGAPKPWKGDDLSIEIEYCTPQYAELTHSRADRSEARKFTARVTREGRTHSLPCIACMVFYLKGAEVMIAFTEEGLPPAVPGEMKEGRHG